ncbi:hypothetical protein [Ferrimonas balearica]|uniref:hypothetical protein n=1 Tax=Ferrimonas balearica TaxID=44012 RepID=UPI001C992535|nr:hypothetical protein [Ferrimonas balearica]MBY5991463.1 hypothetical protein [Ferrimonas balearica]
MVLAPEDFRRLETHLTLALAGVVRCKAHPAQYRDELDEVARQTAKALVAVNELLANATHTIQGEAPLPYSQP